ncbi:SPFH domain-containing protein [Streptomyces tubercidicus]|uniref:SPFH domain-containing protein n=1 Tax=Streptomyces tubercidicus TaxID=47759 RepID=UPI002E19EAAC|nr:SPFH domain-containing protein [Streptomyces tubercidicus]
MKDERVGLPMNSMPPADEFPLFVERLGNTPFKDLDQPEELATQNESTIEFPPDFLPIRDPGPDLCPEPATPGEVRRRTPRLVTDVREYRPRLVLPGWIAVLWVLLCGSVIALIAGRLHYLRRWVNLPEPAPVPLICLGVVLLFAVSGLMINRAGFAVVLSRWGRYRGTVRRTGLLWVNPFLRRRRVDVRLRHFRGDAIAAVDRVGHPVVVSLLFVWRVKETARATFAVSDHEEFLREQAAATVCEVAATLPCDRFGAPGPTLRDGKWFGEEMTRALVAEMAPLGLEIYSVQQLSLSYDTEIAENIRRLQRAELNAELRSTVISDAVDVAWAALEQIRAKEGADEQQSAGQDPTFLRLLALSLLTPSANLKEWGSQWPDRQSSSK